MRIVCAERRTLPSSTAPTFSLCATVTMSGCSPWNENDDVRAATRQFINSCQRVEKFLRKASEKYSCSLSR